MHRPWPIVPTVLTTSLTTVLSLSMMACAGSSSPPVSIDENGPLGAVVRRIDAFNRHDLEGYLAAHHPEVDIIRYPDTLLGRGQSHLRRIFGPDIEAGRGSIEVIDQSVVGAVVISEERLRLGDRSEHLVILYSIADDRIRSIRLVEEGPSRPSSAVEREAKAFLSKYFESMESGEEAKIRALFVEDGRFRWDTDGQAAYASADDVLSSLEQIQGIELKTECASVDVDVASPRHAHVTCAFRTDALRPDGPKLFDFSGVMTFFIERQADGHWAVVRGHTSTFRPSSPEAPTDAQPSSKPQD